MDKTLTQDHPIAKCAIKLVRRMNTWRNVVYARSHDTAIQPTVYKIGTMVGFATRSCAHCSLLKRWRRLRMGKDTGDSIPATGFAGTSSQWLVRMLAMLAINMINFDVRFLKYLVSWCHVTYIQLSDAVPTQLMKDPWFMLCRAQILSHFIRHSVFDEEGCHLYTKLARRGGRGGLTIRRRGHKVIRHITLI